MRRRGQRLGEIANLLGDEATLDFRSNDEHRRLKADLAEWARQIHCFERGLLPTAEMDEAHRKLMREYFR